jgi:hypothetical protein
MLLFLYLQSTSFCSFTSSSPFPLLLIFHLLLLYLLLLFLHLIRLFCSSFLPSALGLSQDKD